ncbi:MAG: M23 family metallopeptidase [Bacilli bacterium]|nr:M23 family metallopeptidase [Bacilli bacterium]
MKNSYLKEGKLLQRGKKILSLFAIALFSVVVLPVNSNSANFRYEDFDWDTFAEQNKSFWSAYCEHDDDPKCEDKVLKAQEKFYKKLYKTLAKYEKKGLFINDNIILQTVFIDMSPSTFSDDGEEYKAEWNTPAGAYVVSDDEVTDEEIDVEYTEEYYQKYHEYMADEKDTLKTLIKNMIAYKANCYGVYGDPVTHTLDDGSTHKSCDNGGVIVDLPLANTITGTKGGQKCVDSLKNNEYGFWEFYTSRWAHDYTLLKNRVLPFLKRIPLDSRYDECVNIGSSYPEKSLYVYNDYREVSYDRYFDFLSYNIYFDKKAHLQSRFRETVLEPAGVKCMTSDVCEESLEAAGKYEEYEGEIVLVRRKIIDDIIFILNNYGLEITYNYGTSQEFIEANIEESERKSYFWPIGSDETEERDGVIYADGEPASTDVISYYGVRTNPVTGEDEMHYGIDIAGVEGETNVVAVYNGEVISIVDNCTVGDYDCNEGLGNMIILSHSNGDYTVYAQLASIDSAIQVGTGVKKGQLLGKVGSTGRTNKSALHYELRKGGNDIGYSVDPLGEMDSSNPRPAVAAGDFSVHETSLTKEEFVAKMRAYCNTHNCTGNMLPMQNVFVAHAEEVYDASIANNVNPELVVVRAMAEGFSPGGSTNNYWGIRCYNNASVDACSKYTSLSNGIAGFADVVKGYDTVSEMMNKYAYIGNYWYKIFYRKNGGIDWGLGGCAYFPSIKEYLSSERSRVVEATCNQNECQKDGTGSCVKTTAEDQKAYATWQVDKKMGRYRYNIFGL